MREEQISEFKLAPPAVVRFGLGSTGAIKQWARFELRPTNDLYWTDAINTHSDVDKTNTHVSLRHSGIIMLSRYVNGVKVSSHHAGNIDAANGKMVDIRTGQELMESGYLYHCLKTLGSKKASVHETLVECLDGKLVNSRLYYSVADFHGKVVTTEHAAWLSQHFDAGDQRSHLYVFRWEEMGLAVSIRFTEGEQPIDIERVRDADNHPHELKRLYVEENLQLSEKSLIKRSG